MSKDKPTLAEMAGLTVSDVQLDAGDEPELADRLMADMGGGDVLGVDADRLYRFSSERGTWAEVDHALARQALYDGYQFASVRTGKYAKNGDEILKPLRLSSHTAQGVVSVMLDKVRRRDFLAARRQDCAACANGLVTMNGFRALQPDDCIPAAEQLAIEWDSEADCPTWVAAISRMWSTRDAADREARIRLLQEFFGAATMGLGPRYQQVLVLYGTGGNGKSVITKTLEQLFPSSARAAVPVHRMADPYFAEMLLHARVNIVSELPAKEVIDGAEFKNIVDGGLLTARRIREAPITFHPKATHIFSANELPASRDQSDGFWRRISVLDFTERMDTAGDCDPFLVEKITAELPGVLRWAVLGALRLVKNGGYTSVESADEIRAEWRMESDVVALWLDQECTLLTADGASPSSGGIHAKDAYSAFSAWCKDSGHFPLSITKWGRRMKSLGVHNARQGAGIVYAVRVKIREVKREY